MGTPKKAISVEIGLGDPRTADRLHVVDLLCSVGKRCSGEVIDVSETGVKIKYRGTKRYQVNDCIGLALRRHDILLLVRAQVVWEKATTSNERVAGFQFVDMKENDMETLSELILRSQDAISVSKSA